MLPLQSINESELKVEKGCMYNFDSECTRTEQTNQTSMVTDPFTVSVIDRVFCSHVMNCVKSLQ